MGLTRTQIEAARDRAKVYPLGWGSSYIAGTLATDILVAAAVFAETPEQLQHG